MRIDSQRSFSATRGTFRPGWRASAGDCPADTVTRRHCLTAIPQPAQLASASPDRRVSGGLLARRVCGGLAVIMEAAAPSPHIMEYRGLRSLPKAFPVPPPQSAPARAPRRSLLRVDKSIHPRYHLNRRLFSHRAAWIVWDSSIADKENQRAELVRQETGFYRRNQ